MCQLGLMNVLELGLAVKPPLPSPLHTLNAPLSWCHRMSSLPSPLKSPVPEMCQLVETVESLSAAATNPPLAWPAQTLVVPASLRHSTSSRPSPLKSPDPTTCQLVETLVLLSALGLNPPSPRPNQP